MKNLSIASAFAFVALAFVGCATQITTERASCGKINEVKFSATVGGDCCSKAADCCKDKKDCCAAGKCDCKTCDCCPGCKDGGKCTCTDCKCCGACNKK